MSHIFACKHSAHMSASFLAAANLRTTHTRQACLRAAWIRNPTQMEEAATRYCAHFLQHKRRFPEAFNDFWPSNEPLLNWMISTFGSKGFFDFVLYPVRGIIHALNRLVAWLYRVKLRLLTERVAYMQQSLAVWFRFPREFMRGAG